MKPLGGYACLHTINKPLMASSGFAQALYWGNDKIEQGLPRDAEFKAVGVLKNVLFHFSLIFSLIFQNFKGGRFTVLIFRFIFHFIFDGLCLQK